MAKIDLGKVVGPQGPQGEKGEEGKQGPIGPVGPTGAVDENTPVVFTEAEQQANIESGEALSIMFGKIRKVISHVLEGAGSTIMGRNLAASQVLVSNAEGKIGVSGITAEELGCLDGVTKNVQEQFSEQSASIHKWVDPTSFISESADMADFLSKLNTKSVYQTMTTSAVNAAALSLGLIPAATNGYLKIRCHNAANALIEYHGGNKRYYKMVIGGEDKGWYSVTMTAM